MCRVPGARVVVAVVLALVLAAPPAAGARAARPAGGWERLVVILRDGAGDPRGIADEISRGHGGRAGVVFGALLPGFAVELPQGAIEAVRRDPRVAAVEPDRRFHALAELPSGVDRIEADQNLTARIDGVDQRVDADIAILDTGIGPHPDLNVVGGADCTGGACVAGAASDGHGHGTHTAGTAAALDDGRGVVGVAPGARLWAVKVLGDDGSGYLSWIIAGLDWVAQQGTVEVVNMSLGCECASAALDAAIARATGAGLVVVVAAGNDGKDAATFSPASNPNVIAVSAMADYDGRPGGQALAGCSWIPDDTFAPFSNYGSVVDLAAPGVCIPSTLPGGGYGLMSGTSMASPHVAGAAALYIVEHGIAASPSRWSTVLTGLRDDWSAPQASPCGFTGGRSSEPMLVLSGCQGAGPATGSVAGRVTDAATGAGIAGATVRLADAGRMATTSQYGYYVMAHVPAGAHDLVASATGFTSESRTVAVAAGGKAYANVGLTASATTGTIAGRVTDAGSGAGIGGARVSVGGTGLSATTSRYGYYVIEEVPAGTPTLIVTAQGYLNQVTSVTLRGGGKSYANVPLTAQG